MAFSHAATTLISIRAPQGRDLPGLPTDGLYADFTKRIQFRRSPPVSSGYATTRAKRPLPLRLKKEVQTLLPASRRESTYKVRTRKFVANSARQEHGAAGRDVRHIRHGASLE
jgi:hypothetical protein